MPGCCDLMFMKVAASKNISKITYQQKDASSATSMRIQPCKLSFACSTVFLELPM